jgi:hypothetical protein
MRKFTVATSNMVAHVLAHQELKQSHPKKTLIEWTAAAVVWEMELTNPTLLRCKLNVCHHFSFPVQSNLSTDIVWLVPTQVAIRQELAEAEALDLASGNDFTLNANISPSVFVSSGLDLEAALMHE